MMYMFPKQFVLHNVFTSKVNTAQTAQKFQDYTLREEEITAKLRGDKNSSEPRLPKIPKRLRGEARRLTERMQVLHARCSYIELLRHHSPTVLDHSRCPNRAKSKLDQTLGDGPQPSTSAGESQPRGKSQRIERKTVPPNSQAIPLRQTGSIVELATAPSQVSAFCQAVLCKVIPSDFWGEGDTRQHNMTVFLRTVDHFIKLRRFESMSLHEISQDLKVSCAQDARCTVV